MDYQIFTDATADISEEMLVGLQHIEIVPMEINIGNKTYVYGTTGNLTVEQFYAMQREGMFASTTQIRPDKYKEAFEPYLQKGKNMGNYYVNKLQSIILRRKSIWLI